MSGSNNKGRRADSGRMKTATLIPIAALALATAGACAAPAGPTTPEHSAPPVASSTTPAETVQDKALDKLVTSASTRASLAKYSREQLRTIMDNVVCKHQNDLLGMTQAAPGAGISSADAGYLLGADAAIGYC
jgi:hypothetical protein